MSRLETKQKIISNCATLFNQKGYQVLAIPTAELEKASGQTKAVLYGYFDTKQAMALAVLDHNLEHKLAIINQHVIAETSAANKLNIQLDLHDPFRENVFIAGGCPILVGAAAAGHAGEEMRQRAAKALHKWQEEMVFIIRSGINNGEFKGNTQPEALAWQLIAMIESALLISSTIQRRKLARQLLDHGKKLISSVSVVRN